MTTKAKIGLAALTIVVAFAFGYYEAPYKTITKTTYVEVEKKTDEKDTNTNKHTDTTTHEIDHPDGTKEIDTHTSTDTNRQSSDKKTDEIAKSGETKTETEKSTSSLNISALAGVSYSDTQIVYGAQVTKDVLGPLNIGLWGLTNKTFGASVGIRF